MYIKCNNVCESTLQSRMCYKLTRINYILVEYGLLGMNGSFDKSLQIVGIFQVSVTFNPKSMSTLSSSGEL